ncbi:MAG: hypothetical protein KDJ52_01295 [Anaerolineae bacterium]|nr:hypothetical protein [Anaerolineae bacterium]
MSKRSQNEEIGQIPPEVCDILRDLAAKQKALEAKKNKKESNSEER